VDTHDEKRKIDNRRSPLVSTSLPSATGVSSLAVSREVIDIPPSVLGVCSTSFKGCNDAVVIVLGM